MQNLLFQKELFTVGEVSKICNVPIQTLHYYDKEGILVPSKIDEQTKYRYYSKENIIRLLLIKELRNIEFSIEEIRQSNNIERLSKKLEDKSHQLENEIKKLTYEREKTVGILDILREGREAEKLTNTIQEKSYKSRYVIVTRRVSCCSREGFIERYGELLKIAKQYGLYITGELTAKLHGRMYDINPKHVDLEVMISVLKPENNCPFIKKEVAYKGVSQIYQGPYEEIKKGYAGMLEYMKENRYRIPEYFMFRYLINMAYTEEANMYITEIILPILK